MKTRRLLCCLLLFGLSLNLRAQQASSQLTDRTTKGIITYLDRLVNDSLIVVGQACFPANLNTAEGYQTYFENLHTQTGKYPGLLGMHYSNKRINDTVLINQLAISHW